jgi:pimeloyl-ACP methyl ester carboxylesterase
MKNQTTPRPPFSAADWLRRFTWRFVLWYAIATVLMYGFQRSLLYRPKVLSAPEFAEQVQSRFGGRASVLPGFDAVVLEPETPAKYTAILFHGNGGNGVDRDVLSSRFLFRGYRLIFAEYPGYAARAGDPNEKVLVQDGLQLLAAVQQRFKGQPVVVVGESLGSGVATQVAALSRHPPAALVLITPFASMTEVAQLRMPIFPVKWLLKDRYESDRHISKFAGPVWVMVSDKDELVGPATGLALHKAAQARGPATLVRVTKAGHNDWWSKMSTAQWDTLLGPAVKLAPAGN